MSPELAALIFGLLAALTWGVADFFAAKASKSVSPETSAIWVSLLGAFVYACIFIFNPGNQAWLLTGIYYAIGAGICIELGIYAFYRGLNAGPVSIVAPISAAYPLITTLVAVSAFGSALQLRHIFGICVIVVGVMAAAGILSNKKNERRLSPGVVAAFQTIVLWGLAYALLGEAVNSIGWQKTLLVDVCAGLIALFVLLSVTKPQSIHHSLQASYAGNRLILLTAALQLSGGAIFSIGLSKTNLSPIITAISACYPSITVILALRHFQEDKELLKIMGAFVTIAGIVLVSA